jgi:putative molybdopterin biosynthesis protein
MNAPMVANTLAAERRARGWSQARMAAEAGVTRQSYAAIEVGEAIPSTAVALRLARALGKGVEELFRLAGEPPGVERAGWAGRGGRGGRVRLARVGGRTLAFGAGELEEPMGAADGVVVGGEGSGVEVELLTERPVAPGLVVVGCDPAFGMVTERLRAERGVEALRVQRGSRAALEALAQGEAHVAGVHLRDPESGEYNGPWVRRMVPFPCTRVTFALWEQGIVVGTGNPLGISEVGDLARAGVRLINREPGSGSRALLDERLHAAGIPPEAITGYGTTGARGHLGLAEAIASGLGDAGVGIRAAAEAYGLGVVPLETERYELIVPDHYLDLPAVQMLLDLLRRPGVRRQVDALGGYDTTSMGLPV